NQIEVTIHIFQCPANPNDLKNFLINTLSAECAARSKQKQTSEIQKQWNNTEISTKHTSKILEPWHGICFQDIIRGLITKKLKKTASQITGSPTTAQEAIITTFQKLWLEKKK